MKHFLWCFLFGFCLKQAAFVTISDDELTPLQENATFTCNVSEPSFASFVVNFTDQEFSLNTDDPDDDVTSILNKRKTFFEKNDMDIVLYILATEENNQTKIHCREILAAIPFSEVVTLTVIGPPLSPEFTFTFFSDTELQLEWDEPFTWPGYDVTHYNITVAGSTTVNNATNRAYSFPLTRGENLEDCQNFTFMVSAVSALGESVPSVNTTSSFIAPGEFREISDPVIWFAQNGDPRVTITLQPPALCDYQTADLVLQLIDENGKKLPAKMQNYTGRYSSITVVFSMDLRSDVSYTLMLEVYSIAGNSTAPNVNFNIQQPFNITKPPFSDLLIPVIGGVAGGFVAIIFVIMIVLGFVKVLQKSRSMNLEPHADVGERDSTYEYIEDYQEITSGRNQYTQSIPLHQEPMFYPRPESPYQDMKSADPGTSPSRLKKICLPQETKPPQNTFIGSPENGTNPIQYPNNDMHVTPGGSVVYRSRGSVGEEDYTDMSSSQQMPCQSTERTLPQPNGEYRFTEC